ncbi:MAG: twin-arginine translocase TatA/TatE family subunit [Pseudomonadota bacterium]
MSIGFWQIMLIVVVLVLLFGRGKISELMADTAKGIKSFKKGMADDEVADTSKSDAKVIEGTATKSEEGSKVS